MKRQTRWLLAGLAPLAAAAACITPYYVHYQRAKPALASGLEGHLANIKKYSEQLESQGQTTAELRAIAERSLGRSPDVVAHRLRAGLSRMATEAGFPENAVVLTLGTPQAVKNPAVEGGVKELRSSSRTRATEFGRADFYVLKGEVQATGSFEEVVRMLALATAQDWISGVPSFSIRAVDEHAEEFKLRVDIETVFLPDMAKDPENPELPPTVTETAPELYASVEAIVLRNPFAPPRAVTVVQVPTPPPEVDPSTGGAPPALPPPYDEWRLTGVSASPRQGALAWMLNTRSGVAVMLHPGDAVLDAVLVSASNEMAMFQIGERRFRLVLNETLAERRPVE